MSSPLPFLVNQTRWSDLLKQLAVAKGLDHVEVLGQLIGAIVLENDRPEHKYLAGEQLAWGQYLLAAAGAGVIGYVGVRNPTGSGKIVVVDRVAAQPAITSINRFYLGLARAPTVTAQNTEQPRDTRIQPTGAFGTAAPQIAGQIVSARSDTIVVLPFVVWEFVAGLSNVATNSHNNSGAVDVEVILAPGDVLLTWISDGVGGSGSNSAVQGSFRWRERTLEPTET
jgi:hypothetical protein